MPIDPLTIPIAIQGAAAGGQAIAAGVGNKKRIKAAKEAATLANERNIENWNRQNAYNDPSAAMARLKAAGLNPNMVYGTGTATGGTSGAVGSASAPVPNIQDIPINMPDVLGTIGQYQGIQKSRAQTALTWGQLGVQALTIESSKLTIEGKALQNQILARTGMEIAQNTVDQGTANIDNTVANTENTRQRTKNLQETVKNIEKTGKNIDASTEQIKSLVQLNDIRKKVENKNWEWFRDYQIKPSDPSYMKYIIDIAEKADTPENRDKLNAIQSWLGTWDSNLEYLKEKIGY